MKTILLILLIFFALLQDSCKKENCACGVENPHETLPWLKNQLQSSCFEVYSFVFEKKEYIGIQDCEHIADGMTTIYDCQGNKTFDFGGFSGAENYGMPVTFTIEFYLAHKKLIFISSK